MTHTTSKVMAAAIWLAALMPVAGAQWSTNLPPELANPTVAAEECRPRGGWPNFYAKIKRGEAVRIAYFGGSITAQDGWRPKTLKWFQEKYPQATFSQINAAIGGTGSDLGVFRCQRDVLALSPDLVLIEFAVNDAGASPAQIYRCMEGVVRQAWRANPKTDIGFVYTIAGNMLETLQADKFPRAASAMEKLADHYEIPTIHMGYEVARLEKAGKLIFKGDKPKTDEEKAKVGDKILFSPDAVHPYNDSGHQLYLEAVVRSLPKIEAAGKAGERELKEPFVADNWEAAKMVPLNQAKLSAGWQKLDVGTNRLAKSFQNRLPELWQASAPGETLTFKFKGTAAGVYDLLGPDCGQVVVTVDEQKPKTMARFDAYCTYHRLAKLMVAEQLPDRVHSIKIEIHPDQPDKEKILAQRQEKMDNPRRFDGTSWYAGYLMLIGDLAD